MCLSKTLGDDEKINYTEIKNIIETKKLSR